MALLKEDYVDGNVFTAGASGGTIGINATNSRVNYHVHDNVNTPYVHGAEIFISYDSTSGTRATNGTSTFFSKVLTDAEATFDYLVYKADCSVNTAASTSESSAEGYFDVRIDSVIVRGHSINTYQYYHSNGGTGDNVTDGDSAPVPVHAILVAGSDYTKGTGFTLDLRGNISDAGGGVGVMTYFNSILTGINV